MTKPISEVKKALKRPVKVPQFGTGNFLRAFVDYYIQMMNDLNDFYGNVVIIKSTIKGDIRAFEKQKNLYTVIHKGCENNKPIKKQTLINCIDRVININKDFKKYIELAEISDLEFIISNTTEAGIFFDSNNDCNFAANLTKFLSHRYKHFNANKDKGLYIIPCELIDNNADILKECVNKYIDCWNLEKKFKYWINNNNYFCNSLVDKIVSGYPNEPTTLGHKDKLAVEGELYGQWVVEDKGDITKKFPTSCIGDIIFDNPKTYKIMKVRILNGAHTAMVALGIYKNKKTVFDVMNDVVLSKYLEKLVHKEIIPTLEFDKESLTEYAKKAFERFKNPYLRHNIEAISLNSVSKFRVRLLPSLLEYIRRYKEIPLNIVLAFTYLLKMYNDSIEKINDSDAVIEIFRQKRVLEETRYIFEIMSDEKLWGMDLTKIKGLYGKIKELWQKADKIDWDTEKMIEGII